jgi:LuxR family maltose regulon positive regulatory protein
VGYTNLARILLTCGDLDGARRACDAMEQVQHQYQLIPVLISNIEQCRVRLWLAEDRLSEALQWAEDHLHRPTDDTLFTCEAEALMMAHVFLKAGQADRVLPLLAPFATSAETQERTGRLIENLVLQAIAFEAIAEQELALAALERALTLAEPEGYVRAFIDEGQAMRVLISDFRFWIATQSTHTDLAARLLPYTDQLVAAFPQAESASIQNPQSKIQNLVEPLSDRELDVLRLLAQGLSNAAIADRLVVSVGTVKSHVHHIYGKLGVQSRTQAILRAKELQLF